MGRNVVVRGTSPEKPLLDHTQANFYPNTVVGVFVGRGLFLNLSPSDGFTPWPAEMRSCCFLREGLTQAALFLPSIAIPSTASELV